MNQPTIDDWELQAVTAEIRRLDPEGARIARVLRNTLDQLYDGQRTGRYRWDQLHKTEKTHCGTLVEINLIREFKFEDGDKLDYRVAGIDVDCKYSQTVNGWMIPPEASDHLCFLITANDQLSQWSLGITRMTRERLNVNGNRDRKVTLNSAGRDSIVWIFYNAVLPPNVLLQLDPSAVAKIMELPFGTRRTNQLFRTALGMRISRAVVATVDRGDDFTKRVRANGGSRTALRREGIIILGQYSVHRTLARHLGVQEPDCGEYVPVRVYPAPGPGPGIAKIEGGFWRVAEPNEPEVMAPLLPIIKKSPEG